MHEGLVHQLIQEVLVGGGPDPEPSARAEALFLTRLAEPAAADVTRVDRTVRPRRGSILEGLAESSREFQRDPLGVLADLSRSFQRDPLSFTAVGDVAEGNVAAQEGRFGEAGFRTLMAVGGLGALLRRLMGRRAAAEVAEQALPVTQRSIIDDFVAGADPENFLMRGAAESEEEVLRRQIIDDFITRGLSQEGVEAMAEEHVAETLLRQLTRGR